MSYTQIRYEVTDFLCVITLDRPDRLNAWTNVMEDEFRRALSSADKDSNVRVIAVTGAGRGFCAGADVKELQAALADPDGTRRLLEFEDANGAEIAINFKHRFSYMLAIGKPIVCAINGPVAGVGLCMALFADLRYMVDGSVLTTSFAARGLIAEHASAWMLPRLVGPMNALKLLYSTVPIDAGEAERMGLVNKLPAENFLEAVKSICRTIASTASPRSLRVIKRQVYSGLFQTLIEAANSADTEMFDSFTCDDFREGVAHYLEKRPPAFSGR